MTRLQLFGIRLAVTSCLLLPLVVLVRLLWYPGAYAAISGVGKLLLILIMIAVIVGPGLSTLVFRPGKKGLKLDLGLLAALEIGVVMLGAWQIYARQPFYAVLAVDRFEAVSRAEVDTALLRDAALQTRPGHEPRLVYAELPTDAVKLEKLIDETLFGGKQDIDRRPEFWRPYPEGVAQLKAVAKPLGSMLREDSARADKARRWLSRRGGDASDYIYLPLRGRRADAAMILHADIGFPAGTLDVDPW